MTKPKEQSGGLTAAEQERNDFAADIDYWRLFGVEIIHWTEIAGAYLCRAEKAEVELQRMKAVLREHEWQHPPFSSDPYEYCFMCGAKKEKGHEPACWYAALLTDTPAGEYGDE